MFIKLATVFGIVHLTAGTAGKSLDIETTSGIVQGFVDQTTPHVAQFLGIPFAEQPVGPLRWLPPLRKLKESGITQAKRFGHACPKPESDENMPPNIYVTDAPEFLISPQSYQGEDCLSVNVWLPWNESQSKVNDTTSLPVLVWLYGGGFTAGGGTVPYQNPSQWIERSKKHIVVGIKYVIEHLQILNILITEKLSSGHIRLSQLSGSTTCRAEPRLTGSKTGHRMGSRQYRQVWR